MGKVRVLARKTGVAAAMAVAGALSLAPQRAAAGDVILQYFESKWKTIERRAPDVFMARYQSLWVPPPGKADTGGYSVGYDVFDRFDLGTPYDQTLYGTAQSFRQMNTEFDRAGIGVFVDAIVNHNGFRDGSTPDFEANGGYPGFVTTLDSDVDGDFHGAYEEGDLNGRLAGLNDIAQEKNHRFTRHPVPGATNNIPNETPREENRQFYPDLDLPLENGRHPFNLADPMAGDPYEENATGLLMRYLQWMVEVQGVDGFRIDAVKHVPQFFFNDFYDQAVYNVGRNPIDGSAFTPFSFGEALDSNFDLLTSYTRKDGYGNRDMLDFPLFFAMNSVFGAQGFGDMRDLEYSSFDGSDGDYNDGSRGVMFVNSHDNTGGGYSTEGPGFNLLGHAHILTRTGYPSVYYNAAEFGDGRDFPKPGRPEALGNGNAHITTLVRINKEYARGGHATRWIDDTVYVYERLNACLVGLNDRGDSGYDERSVDTSFAPGTVLVELTGNATSTTVDPNDDIFDTITVGSDSRVTLRVPRNRNTNDTFHGLGYVIYGPQKPDSTLTIANASSTIGPDPDDGRSQAQRRLTTLQVVTADTIEVQLDVADSPVSDAALIKVNFGEVDVDGDGTRNAHGEFAGFENFPNVNDGTYTASIDATNLKEGYTYIETVAFLERPADTPAIYDNERAVVYLDRVPPTAELLFPPRTGSGDITSADYEAAVQSDHTANAVHILLDVPADATDEQVLALVNDSNKARQHDRLEWRRVLSGFAGTGTTTEITVVAFEESGNYSITRFDNIGVDVATPEILIGVDTDPSSDSVSFESFPASIDTAEYANEIVVRVNTESAADGPISFNDGDYTVMLQVDDGAAISAEPYDASLLPPVGRLVQNDQNLGGDDYDEFRFLWRNYGPGPHTFRAVAQLTAGGEPPSEAIANVTVADDASGPTITITNPAPPGETVTNPTEIVVAGTFGSAPGFAQIFLDGPADSQLIATLTDPPAGAFSVTKPVGSFDLADTIPAGALSLQNGTYTVRVRASTGPNGTGFTSEANSSLTVDGLGQPETLPPFAIDGDATEFLALPVLAASAADGSTGSALPADYGADGTLTELHAAVRDGVLGIALRGDMFGANEDSLDNVSILYIDVNAGSGGGTTEMGVELTDESDGLRGDISRADFTLAPALVTAGVGFDAVFGMTSPGTAYGYTVGGDGLPGAFDNFEFNSSFSAGYDAATAGFSAAPGTTIAGPNTFEIVLPLEALGNPDPRKIRLAAVTAPDTGGASPNTLPENASDSYVGTQTIEAVAAFGTSPTVLINEVFAGVPDWVELYNPGASPVDLSGWALRMNDKEIVPRDYVFPDGTTIAPGGYLLVSDDGGTTPPADTATVLHTGFNIPWDETRGASVGLVDPWGIGIDYVDWRNSANEETSGVIRKAPDGTTLVGDVAGPASGTSNHSLARDSASTDTDSAADWDPTSGADASVPTPGAANIGSAPVVPGDANGDGVVTPADAQAAFECFLFATCGTGVSSDAADIAPDDADGCVDAGDGDGSVTPADAQRIFNHALQIISACP
ncbi:MAG: hypothetical protein PWP23_2399 [Candidatus Sumerlaeota bacterium]|nr:hypothetical protein [Candidatus Sumerlaeota bacterium]